MHFLVSKFVVALLVLLTAGLANAGGGIILTEDRCVISIEFYTAHFTAYQPDSSGSRQFCEDLDDIGATIFVLDYLHDSLKQVPVDFRIIKNVTSMGKFTRLEHIDAIDNIEQHTVFYREPLIEIDGSYQAEHFFTDAGEYVGIVSAGHPTNGKTYYAVFPFTVGLSKLEPWVATGFLLTIGALLFIKWQRRKATEG
jgi:hypothetical protein